MSFDEKMAIKIDLEQKAKKGKLTPVEEEIYYLVLACLN